MLNRRLVRVLGLLLFLSGCGTFKYNRAWSRFEAAPQSAGFEGRWKGEWKSDWNGHSGKLRCMVSLEEENRYLAWFHSTYGIFSFRHKVIFTLTEESDDQLQFEGEEDLGKMVGGVYRYRGTVSGDAFGATYAADNGDHGVFDMTRVDVRDVESTATAVRSF
ncbi:MAG: hypothetical protein CMJ89_13495 [Planctomycetes bacterium]|jgi:hypothetical protein|nr:hypothetical protein [Planctomycetota bacterium]